MKRKIFFQMDAKILILIIFLPIVCFGQESKYTNDTIYIKFEKKIGNKNGMGIMDMEKIKSKETYLI